MARWLLLCLALLFSACKESPPPPPPPPASPAAALVDINHATQAELEALPDIGRAYAAHIVAGRPYANKTQLRSRGILPESVYDRVAPRLVARERP